MKRINLLPKLKQKELVFERLFSSVLTAVIIATVILLSGVVVQVGVKWYLSRQSSSVDAEIDNLKRTANKTENAAVKQKIKLVNAQLEDFDKLVETNPQWSRVLSAFVKDVPDGVKITQFHADSEKKTVSISGYSPTRDLVIDLYNNINGDKDNFKDINYPLENVSQPNDVKFNYDFTIIDSVLTNSKPETNEQP